MQKRWLLNRKSGGKWKWGIHNMSTPCVLRHPATVCRGRWEAHQLPQEHMKFSLLNVLDMSKFFHYNTIPMLKTTFSLQKSKTNIVYLCAGMLNPTQKISSYNWGITHGPPAGLMVCHLLYRPKIRSWEVVPENQATYSHIWYQSFEVRLNKLWRPVQTWGLISGMKSIILFAIFF